MNERIKQLAEQTMNSDTAPHLSEELYCFTKSEFEKFAELIVLECAGVTLDYKNGDHYAGWCDHAKEILKHFGVEE